MPMPPLAQPLTTRRLMLLWLSWTVAATLGWILESFNSFYLFPRDYFTIAGAPIDAIDAMSNLGWSLLGISTGLLVGLPQAFTLRHFFGGKKWFLWPLLTSVGLGVFFLIDELTYWEFIVDIKYGLLSWQAIRLFALPGLLIGVMQVPILERKFHGLRWWLWPLFSGIGWMVGRFVWFQAWAPENTFLFISYRGMLHGSIYGLITGLGLVLLLRGTPIPRVKEKAQAF